ncbi:MAG: DUF4355 domain-containing protein [Clostridia bacterium]|nr:DUF4355 domain-containing protein [Clostridia bacterium]
MKEDIAATQQADIQNDEGHVTEKVEKKEVVLPKTVEELQALLQSETDKRVTQALKTAQEKWHQKMMQKLEAERKEAERLAKLATEQREREVLEEYKRKIEEKERALVKKELEISTINHLVEKRLPIEFKDFILDKDEETTLKRLEKFCKVWEIKLEEAVRTVSSENLTSCAEKTI